MKRFEWRTLAAPVGLTPVIAVARLVDCLAPAPSLLQKKMIKPNASPSAYQVLYGSFNTPEQDRQNQFT